MFSTALPEINAAAGIAALEIVAKEPERRTRLETHSRELRHELTSMGLDIGNSTSQIIPIVLGDSEKALATANRLAEAGIYAPVIRPPSVPNNESRLRLSLSSQHSKKQIDILLNFLAIM